MCRVETLMGLHFIALLHTSLPRGSFCSLTSGVPLPPAWALPLGTWLPLTLCFPLKLSELLVSWDLQCIVAKQFYSLNLPLQGHIKAFSLSFRLWIRDTWKCLTNKRPRINWVVSQLASWVSRGRTLHVLLWGLLVFVSKTANFCLCVNFFAWFHWYSLKVSGFAFSLHYLEVLCP